MLEKILLPALLPAVAFTEELPALVKVIEKQGITVIKTFDAPGGMKNYLGRYQDTGVTIYLTSDGKYVISGYTYNEEGENLSNTFIEKEVYAPAGREMWQWMERPHWSLDGKKDASVVVYVFADPFCSYCKQFWQQAHPWVGSSEVQLKTLSVGVIEPESPVTVVAILVSKDPVKAWQQYKAPGGKLKLSVSANVSIEQMKVLSGNEKLMDDLGANVTPATYYMSKENTLRQVIGLPDQKTPNIIMGDK